MVSLKEVAEAVPCSPATVSVVLSGRGDAYRISGETQRLVREKARSLGYVSRRVGAAPAASERPTAPIRIGFFIGLVDSSPLGDMLSGLLARPSHNGRPIEYCTHPFLPGELPQLEPLLLNNDYDGLLLLPTGKNDCRYLSTLTIRKPCVIMTQTVPGFNCVVPDRIECGALIAKLFIAKGYRNVGLVTRNTLSESGTLRSFGFTSTYEKYGSPDAKITLVEDRTDGDYGLASMNELLDKTDGEPLEAIFVTEPNNFSGTFASLRSHGKLPLRGLELVVFGNYSDNAINRCLDPSITTIGIPVSSMVVDSVELICHQIDGGLLHGVTKVHHPELSFRESCTKPENWDSIS